MSDNSSNNQADFGANEASLPLEHRIPVTAPALSGKPDETGKDGSGDPFDPDKLRLSQDFESGVAVERVLTTVPCRKPKRQEFVRVRPGDEWRLETAIFEDQKGRETYLVNPDLLDELASEVVPVCLFTAITRQNDLFLWPVKLPREGGRSNSWNESAIAAARRAERRWVRVSANMTAGYYDVFQGSLDFGDPTWPAFSLQNLLKLAFDDRYIDRREHPLLRELRGEI